MTYQVLCYWKNKKRIFYNQETIHVKQHIMLSWNNKENIKNKICEHLKQAYKELKAAHVINHCNSIEHKLLR